MSRLAIALMFAVLADLAAAASLPIVEGVQSPAWVERAGKREPLSVGMQLGNSDRVASGADGRVLLRMPEGSLVKLGEEAQLALDRLSSRREPQGNVVTAALDVLRGAFRFTTQASARFSGRRQIDVRIATVTAGIRGTDVWGKAASDRDIVCLIEGEISVQREGEPAFAMDQPRSFYIAPKNAPALPVQPVPEAQLAQWSAETEIRSGAGGARMGGRWKVYFAEVDTQQAALAAYDAARDAGFPAEISPSGPPGQIVYRVRVSHLPTQAEAEALGERLRNLSWVTGIRVSRS